MVIQNNDEKELDATEIEKRKNWRRIVLAPSSVALVYTPKGDLGFKVNIFDESVADLDRSLAVLATGAAQLSLQNPDMVYHIGYNHMADIIEANAAMNWDAQLIIRRLVGDADVRTTMPIGEA